MSGPGEPIPLLVADDQFLIRDALARLLDAEPDLRVVGQAADGEEAVRLAAALGPRVVLLDIEMPRLDGLEAAARILRDDPTRIVAILTTFGRPGYFQKAVALGVRGFLLKDRPVGAIAAQIRRLAAGERVLDEKLAVDAAVAGPCPLTEREREVLRLAGEGRTVAEVAGTLHLSEGTVRNYLSLAIQKLGVGNRIQAYRKAQREGWV